jgi:hypothetical protein
VNALFAAVNSLLNRLTRRERLPEGITPEDLELFLLPFPHHYGVRLRGKNYTRATVELRLVHPFRGCDHVSYVLLDEVWHAYVDDFNKLPRCVAVNDAAQRFLNERLGSLL